MQDVLSRFGANIRRLRTERDLSLSQLSRQSGVAKGTLSKLELSIGNPTVETLWSIANALDVPFDDLFAESGDEILVVRRGEPAKLTAPGLNARMIDRVFGREASDVAEVVYLRGQTRDAIPDSPGTITRLYVAQGRLRIELPTVTLELETGDFARFYSDTPYRCTALERNARVLMIVTFGAAAWRTGGDDPMVLALRAAEAVGRESAPRSRGSAGRTASTRTDGKGRRQGKS